MKTCFPAVRAADVRAKSACSYSHSGVSERMERLVAAKNSSFLYRIHFPIAEHSERKAA
ncbi:MAG: hypothetical protein II711_00270 [Clostridia bacterium]|nr:hypothetical protein [Clostridia bacterium]